MAEDNPKPKDIEVDLDDYEQRHIYNSICQYVSYVAGNSLKKLTDICNTVKPQNLNKNKQPSTTEIFPKPIPAFDTVNPSRRTKVIPRRGSTIVIPVTPEPRIKRIDSSSLLTFLAGDGKISEDTQSKTYSIKDINREIILNFVNLREDSGITELKTPELDSVDEFINADVVEKQEKVIDCLFYQDRPLVVLPIPDDREKAQIIFNSNGKWCPNGGIGPGYPQSINCPFYRSTGQSNPDSRNFPNMWFPFFRIKTSKYVPGVSLSKLDRGWIYKAWGLQSVKQLRQRLNTIFNIPLPELGQDETKDILYCLLEKFSHWWQIQLSLQLPEDENSLWSTNKLLIEFKKLVLNYDYDHFGGDKNCFIPIKQSVKKDLPKYKLNTIINITEPEEINIWLRKGHYLCIEDSEDVQDKASTASPESSDSES